jgi:hypothetical protein
MVPVAVGSHRKRPGFDAQHEETNRVLEALGRILNQGGDEAGRRMAGRPATTFFFI